MWALMLSRRRDVREVQEHVAHLGRKAHTRVGTWGSGSKLCLMARLNTVEKLAVHPSQVKTQFHAVRHAAQP